MKPLSLALLVFTTGVFLAGPAKAESAFPTTNVYLRAGPESSYPVVSIIPRGQQVEILGCIDGLRWCEVETEYDHGWVASAYLQTLYRNRPITIIQSYDYGYGTNIVVFRQDDYWDRYYRKKSFYRSNNNNHWVNNDDDHDHHYHNNDHDNNNDNNNHQGNDNNNGHSSQKPAPAVIKPLKYPHMASPKAKPTYNPNCDLGVDHC